MSNTKYIFVVGGVMSSVGKGIASASIAKILQSRGFSVSLIKCDMYVNIDAGTMRPTEHGEVFVGDDGIEADQDLGTYERFVDQISTSENYITTGQVYQEVIRKERNLEYKGEDVEVVPDIPNEILRRIGLVEKKNKSDFIIIEIGGTVGEYQNVLFLEAARMMKLKKPEDVVNILVSYLPIPPKVGEMKSKPTQYAARTLNGAGIQADFIICRSEQPLDKKRREKIAIFCNVASDAAISAPDVDSVYDVPVNFIKEKLDDKILKKFNINPRKTNMKEWRALASKLKRLKKEVKIAVVGKYFGTGDFELADSYISVIEAAKHASWYNNLKPKFTWIDSEKYEKDPKLVSELKEYDGVIVPGGFGTRGIEGVITAIKYVRLNNIPYLGLCYGMQLATIEFARNVAKIRTATTAEMDDTAKHQVIHIMPDQEKKLLKKDYGASMRLGSWPAKLLKGSKVQKAYRENKVDERHRHRYEFNNEYRERLEKAGLIISGTSPDNHIVEIVESEDHPFFVGTQFHPEFKSRPMKPHPLFREFVKASIKKK
jgi:CTP synthase